jgi:lipoprotein-anchoring transpeptidase ErfK/SrfK
MRRRIAVLTAVLALAGAGAAGPVAAAAVEVDAPVRPVRHKRATVAKIVAPVVARAAPSVRSKAVWNVPTATGWSEQSQVLLVLRSARDRNGRTWLQLDLPIRPNGRTGWIPADYAALATTRYWIAVSVARRLVTVYRDGRVARRFRAVVGTSGTPTPRGLFAVWEMNRQPDPAGFLGPWAIPITALSNVLESYGGGPGRVAIHGRAGASLLDPLGTAASHGCIRVDNGNMEWLVRNVPRGTPFEIR